MIIEVEPHPHLALGVFCTRFPVPLGDMATPGELAMLLDSGASPILERSEALRTAVRDLLRFGGYKPTGRGKPASEYLVRAASAGTLGSINLAVDACNATSLHCGLPISVVDLDRAQPPLNVGLAKTGESFVFNPSGQSIDVSGLLCLRDAQGPCANAVKDSQRTKTNPLTRRTLSLVWAPVTYGAHLERATRWYRDQLEKAGAVTEDVETE